MEILKQCLDYLHELNCVSVLVRLLLALFAGVLIGDERGRHGRAAGLRTYVLLSVGAAMSSLCGIYMVGGVLGDPSRIAAGVISGIGFLCAGIILIKNSSTVKGLTTAAAMWATATVGIAFGAGFYFAGIVATSLIFIALTLMIRLEVNVKKERHYYLEIGDASITNAVIKEIQSFFPDAHAFEVLPSKSGIPSSLGIAVSITDEDDGVDIVERLHEIDGVIYSIVD